ncbi:MAG: preprotein translocase subunit YajC [Lachnospiraceae bacterium]|nr:preprotein translocase subunit YajC [Lachnospiraceae bacterium]
MQYILGAAQEGSGSFTFIMVLEIVVLVAGMYFLFVRPQKKEQKRLGLMLAELSIGDSVLTTAGFYGVVIDVADDTVIVEFGNNKNCRIPMKKDAIVQVEKAGTAE